MRAHDEFVAVLAHDLQNPLTAIQGRVQLLRRRMQQRAAPVDAQQVLATLDSIERSATSMTSQIQELLDTTRLHTGQQLALRKTTTDLVELTRELVRAHSAEYVDHPIQLHVLAPSLLSLFDAVRIRRVLANLLSNAVMYSPAGAPIDVRIDRRDAQDGLTYAEVVVTDRGIGIPAEDLPHVFEPFHRARNVPAGVKGSGLGLASARLIVEQHGGTLSLTSQPGEGTRVTVRLPLDSLAEE